LRRQGRLSGRPFHLQLSVAGLFAYNRDMSEPVTASVDPIASGGSVHDFWVLLKPRVMSLVIFTAFVGLVVAPTPLHPFIAATALLCIAIGAGAAAALNMAYDSDIDAIMKRTRTRPVPAGRVSRGSAAGYGMVLSVLSVMVMGIGVNWAAAALLAFSIFFYAVIYTMWLKRSTPQNIVIGGAAGAFPPAIGWVAATGHMDLNALAMFLIIFMWTPPHFWALALYKAGDYEAAGVPMLPNVRGAAVTRQHIWLYTWALVAVTALPVITGLGGRVYGATACVLGLMFLVLAFKVWRSRAGEVATAADEASLYAVTRGDRAARNLFAFSILYLFALFGALLADHLRMPL